MFENHLKRTKFLLFLQGISVAVTLFLLFTLLAQVEQLSSSSLFLAFAIVLVMLSLNLSSFYGLLKKKLWVFKLMIALYFIQMIGIETPNFSLAFSSGIEVPISVNVNEVTVSLNLLAILVVWLSYTSLNLLKKG
ncbi:hypothetical protein [Vibrio parahaemolyticus]|uniref:hypothetical protein n=1 Tax=Vibrio parahaemolyticus TaxID=670 RepID=UPI0007A03711|nr:hypothetical protein [Vibrio parahaemolyticus]ELB2162870.1 hypothetical protein [Vibrio parahaemolyticus]KYX32090.1 hypothetical protein AVO50_18280 [Vibrio parahaemolyticus]TOH44701.1 hypothetical protein CGI80_25285 [Vibrio parahaemolyticus]TOJ73675.1 hypothetical protein CGI33_21125 [Vibrio parahaemolyticus]HCE2133863.1 hypothetical protein [Vibrio parahaemolyticus]